MATVTPVPMALGMLVAVGAFSALLWWLLEEERQPVRVPEPVRYRGPRQISHTRIVMIGVLFALWSIWSTARPVSGWR